VQAEVERMKRDGCLSEHQLAIMKECGFDVADLSEAQLTAERARSAALQAENERMRAAVMTAIATSPLDTTVTEMREDIVKALSQPALPHTCVLTATTVDGSVPLLCKACALAQPAPTDKP